MKKRKSTNSGSVAGIKKGGEVVGRPKGPPAKAVAVEAAAVAVAPLEVVERSAASRQQVEAAEGSVMVPEWEGVVVVDEQMWWGGQWFPSWDVQVMGEAYISALYSDVWDGYDDIWGFRNSEQIPTRPTK